MISKLEDLRLQFPGLFRTPFCTTASEAEHHADGVAAALGLTLRAANWISGTEARRLEYRDHLPTICLTVVIDRKWLPKGQPCWFFKSSVERLDARLILEGPPRIKAQAFQHDVKQLVSRLRVLNVQAEGRVLGQLRKWNVQRGYGYLECAPGVRVYLNIHDVHSSERPKIRNGHWFSFQIEPAAGGQKAINVRYCPPPE